MTLTLSEYRRLALAALWVGLFVTTGIVFAFIPNIEFVTTLAFLSGIIFGPLRGAVIAATAEGLFSAMNPLGSGLGFPILFIFQVLAMAVIALVGGWLFRWEPSPGRPSNHIALGILGGCLTLMYDFLTAFSFPLTAGVEEMTLWAATLAGLPFFLIHISANSLIFGAFMPTMMGFTRYHLRLHGFLDASA